ncbi:DEAD/DEAH box helicase [Glycomyces harbinensis]|uniref:AAA domain-containing protein n=1 Tax=Glycomyces harbinensis TaxID=58114 RepID=A0A1G7B091_9ACTN|nr:AAA domain-containing protein [Glycomyces harbinensis]SDE20340.1 AAA domain-containing protein [Glycomyces harbinensis]
MHANELGFGNLKLLQLRLRQPKPTWLSKNTTEVVLRHSPLPGDRRLRVHSRDLAYSVDAEVDAGDVRLLRQVLDAKQNVVSWPADVEGTTAFVHTHLFENAAMPDEPVPIGVGDSVIDRICDITGVPKVGFHEVQDWLIEEFTLPAIGGSDRLRFVLSSSPSEHGATLQRGFSLLGVRWAADVAWRDGRYQIVRLLEVSHRRNTKPKLGHAFLRFVDASTQAESSESLRAALTGLFEDGRSYIQLWNAYDQLEREVRIAEAEELGLARYDTWKPNADGSWCFSLVHGSESERFMRNLLRMETASIELEAAEDGPPELAGGGSAGRTVRGTVCRPWPSGWAVNLAPPTRSDHRRGDPPTHGVLFLALTGTRISQERRATARERIWSGTAEMPYLARLIEGLDLPPTAPRSLSPYARVLERVIRESFSGGTPTESQEEALRLALQTPDILVVQGPPGTGKTQFITALLRCLDALGESARAFNRTLVTSFQHDAVDNIVRKARNKGLPPARVDSDEKKVRQSARLLRDDIAGRVRHQSQMLPEVERLRQLSELQSLVESYDQAPTTQGDLVELLERAERLAGGALDAPLRQRLTRVRTQAAVRNKSTATLLAAQHQAAVRAARSLRTSPGAFADDGPNRALHALPKLEEAAQLNEDDRTLLKTAAGLTAPAEPRLLEALAALQLRTLRRLGTDDTSVPSVPARDPEAQALLHEILDAAENAVQSGAEGISGVLAKYLDDLGSDLALIQGTLQSYNSVLASTVQQADSRAMHLVVEAPIPVFGSVVVDEAARANPLDLMIPLSCAKDRVILVGDHKQLPHVLEQKLERELERTGKVADTALLRTSLFQRWFDKFKDKVAPIRTITLDEQFRMHPTLGAFVSRVFYEPESALQSHESTRALMHDFDAYRGKVAGWIDVPNDGSETRLKHSFMRPREARRVVQELNALAEADAERKLSFGIISYYKSQVAEIQKALLDAQLLVPHDDEDEIRLIPSMQWTDEERPRPRLKVGTIDAFQGMEFDVVLLSVTRSSVPDDAIEDPLGKRRYGHLTSEQRMCVAMSRQRRLLIAVGDAEMANRASAPVDPADRRRSLVEGLVAFRELCEGPDGAGIRH